MNKRYMDFVPKGKKVPVRKSVPVAEEPEVYLEETLVEELVMEEPAPKKVVKPAPKPVVKPVAKPAVKPVAKPAPKPVPKPAPVREVEPDVAIEEFFAVENHPRRRGAAPEYGVIEEYKPKFVQTEVKKRPLGGKPGVAKPALKPAPRKVVAAKAVRESDAKLEAARKEADKAGDKMMLPETRFVNTEKVEKRPLSKNVYKKKIVAPKEEPTGPVTIITKPDKGSHIGVIVTIILTIILGAAAGTVAFLLLPK